MQPATAGDESSSGGNAVRKWGPVAAIVLIVAAVAGVIVVSGGDDDDGESSDTTTAETTATTDAGSNTTAAPTTAPDDSTETTESPATTAGDDGDGGDAAEIVYPLTFSQAEEQGIEVAWDERCDTETGQWAMPWFFAPECFAPFEGDNGGETTSGVTGDTIKVVYYLGPDDDPVLNFINDAIANDDTNADDSATIQGMTEVFNSFYELYGRTVELEVFEGSGISSDEVAARADAVRIAEEIQPFAVVGGPVLTNAFADELAANGIVCLGCGPGQPQEWYAERDPYVWTTGIGALQSREHVREFITKQLAGGNAEFAGDPDFQSQPRTFGHVYLESSAESQVNANALIDGLAADGIEMAQVQSYVLDPASLQASAAQIIAQMKDAGVTTVILSADPVGPRDLTREATAQEYFPEWVIASGALVDTTAFARTYDQEQWANAFGVSHNWLRTPPEQTGFYRLYEWFNGSPPPADDTIEVLIPSLSTMFTALQQTGPDLTPETFRDGVFTLASEPAITAPFLTWGEAGIWDGLDYNGVDDAVVVWWDPNATGIDEIRKEGQGMYQYADGGARYLPGEWPALSALFDAASSLPFLDTPPADETPPDYAPPG
ncbi:MAG: ABC transporter substrate-binding protein [Ilumatobacteraceae bacterium]|nr:ABC transporter substrate-binding protein [Ilumatobacteraceae bacterium]